MYGLLRGGPESTVVSFDGKNAESSTSAWKVPAMEDIDKIFSYSRVAIENADILKTRMSFDQQGLDQIELPLIGVNAIASSVSGTSTDYVNVCTLFQLETRIVIKCPNRSTDYTSSPYNSKNQFLMLNYGSSAELPEASRFYSNTQYGLGIDPGEGAPPQKGGAFYKASSGYSLRSRHRHGYIRHSLLEDPYMILSEIKAAVALEQATRQEASAGAAATGRRRRSITDGDEQPGTARGVSVGQLLGLVLGLVRATQPCLVVTPGSLPLCLVCFQPLRARRASRVNAGHCHLPCAPSVGALCA